jgi:hypothetical protein
MIWRLEHLQPQLRRLSQVWVWIEQEHLQPELRRLTQVWVWIGQEHLQPELQRLTQVWVWVCVWVQQEQQEPGTQD